MPQPPGPPADLSSTFLPQSRLPGAAHVARRNRKVHGRPRPTATRAWLFCRAGFVTPRGYSERPSQALFGARRHDQRDRPARRGVALDDHGGGTVSAGVGLRSRALPGGTARSPPATTSSSRPPRSPVWSHRRSRAARRDPSAYAWCARRARPRIAIIISTFRRGTKRHAGLEPGCATRVVRAQRAPPSAPTRRRCSIRRHAALTGTNAFTGTARRPSEEQILRSQRRPRNKYRSATAARSATRGQVRGVAVR